MKKNSITIKQIQKTKNLLSNFYNNDGSEDDDDVW